MRSLPRLLALLVAIAIPAAIATAPVHAAPLAERVPDDAIIYVGFDGATSEVADLDQRHLGQLLERTQLRDALTQSLPDALRRFAEVEHEPDLALAADAIAELAPVLIDRRWAFYFAGLDETTMMPRLGLLIDAGPDRETVQAWIDQLTQMGAPVQRIDHDDYIGAVLDPTFDPAEDAGLAASERFDDATAPLPGQRVALAYVDVDAIREMALEQLRQQPPGLSTGPQATQVTQVLAGLGLDAIQTAAWAASFDGPRWRTDAFIHAPAPRQGLLAWLSDGDPITLDDLAAVPASATWLLATRVDLHGLYETIGEAVRDVDADAWHEVQGGLAMLGMMLGVDIENELIAALGPHWLAWRDADVAGPASVLGLVLSNDLREPERAASALDALVRSANHATQPHWDDDPHFRFVATEHRGTTVHSFAFMFTQPSYAIHDGRLYVGLLPQAVTEAIDFAIDGGDAITAREGFADMRESLGQSDVLTRSYTDLAPAAEAVYGELLIIGQMLPSLLVAMDHDADGAALHRLPTLGQLRSLLEPAGRVAWASDDGLHTRSITPFPGAAALGHEGGSGAIVAPMGVGIMLPAIASARHTARGMQSSTQARGIHQAQVMYSMGNRERFANDIWVLLEGDYFTPDYAISPNAGLAVPHDFRTWPQDEQATWIRENASYVLIPDLVDDLDTNKVALFERPEHSNGDTIAVAFNDNHVQTLPVHEARRLIQEQTGQTLEELYERQATYGQD